MGSKNGPNEGRIKNFKYSGTVTERMVVVWGANDDTVKPPTAANEVMVGVVFAFDSDQGTCDVVMEGNTEVVAGAPITVGAYVVINGTAGKVKTAAEAGGAVNYLCGQTTMTAGADGDIITMELVRSPYQSA